MAFVNEYIPEVDYDKYDLRRICGEHNEINRGHMYSRDWTIDRERDAFLIQVWSHHEAEFKGWAFYWKGEWMFFEMAVRDAWDKPEEDSCWSLYQIKGFTVPEHLVQLQAQIVDDLRSGFSAYAGGGVFVQRANRCATIDFSKE